MKYELLIDFGQHKKGTIIEQASWGDHPQFATRIQAGFVSQIRFYIDDVPILVDQGIIRKVEEPKFTESEMIELLEFARLYPFAMQDRDGCVEIYNTWLKSKQEGK